LKIKAQQDHELALEQWTAAVAKAQREYDAAAEATKQAHELLVLKEKLDYERMQIEQKKLEQEMAKHSSREADILQLRIEVGRNLVLSRNHSKAQRCHALKSLRQH